MKRVLGVLMIVVFALGATACATPDGGAAAARIQQQMNNQGGPN